MLNSPAANRRLVLRVVLVQSMVALGVALAFWLFRDARAAGAAAFGGGVVALGSLVMGLRSMSGGMPTAGVALARLVSGIVLKWLLVIGALFLALARLGLPPLPLLAGLVATLAAAYPIRNLEA